MIISMKIALVCPASLPASKFSGMPYEEIYGNLEWMEILWVVGFIGWNPKIKKKV